MVYRPMLVPDVVLEWFHFLPIYQFELFQLYHFLKIQHRHFPNRPPWGWPHLDDSDGTLHSLRPARHWILLKTSNWFVWKYLRKVAVVEAVTWYSEFTSTTATTLKRFLVKRVGSKLFAGLLFLKRTWKNKKSNSCLHASYFLFSWSTFWNFKIPSSEYVNKIQKTLE